jgi:purine-cytosine permease-like protein
MREQSQSDMALTPRGRRICQALIVLAFVNFIGFFVIGLISGGDAFNGKVEEERYYLGNHGHYTQVNWAVYAYSYVHAISVMATHLVAIVAGLLLVGDESFRRQSRQHA